MMDNPRLGQSFSLERNMNPFNMNMTFTNSSSRFLNYYDIYSPRNYSTSNRFDNGPSLTQRSFYFENNGK